jgi:PAS domain S-box-containing protein
VDRRDHIQRVLWAIRNVHKLIMHEDDPSVLVQRACETLTETLGYSHAWIGLLDQSSKLVAATAASGFDGNPAPLDEQLRQGYFPKCMSEAMGSNEVVLIRDPASSCADCPIAADYPDRSILARSLAFQGVLFGALIVSVPPELADDTDELMLFEELADDVGLALHRIRSARLLRDTERRYAEIYENGRDGILYADPTGRILEANAAFCDMLGYTPEELQSERSLQEFTPDRWVAWEKEEIWERRLLTAGYSGIYEKELIRRDGTVFPVELQAYAVFDSTNRVRYLWGIVRDISARKEDEARLHASEARFRTLIDSSPLTVLVLRDDRYVYCNPRGAAMLGYDATEAFVGLSGLEAFAPACRESIRKMLSAASRGESPPPAEAELLGSDQKPLSVMCSVVPIDFDGRPAILVVAQDISEPKRAQRAAREANLRLQAAIRAGHVGLWDWNLETDEVWYSAEWKRQIGYEDHEIGNSVEEWSRRVHDEDAASMWERIEQALHGPKNEYQAEFRFRHKDGSWRWILAHGSVMKDVDGRAYRTLGSHTDITERKATEQALRRSEQRYRDMFEKNRAVKLLIEPGTGRIVQANSAACEFYGYSRRTLTSLEIWDLNTLGENKTRERMGEATDLTRTIFEFQHRLANGEVRDVQVYTGPCEVAGQKLLHSIVLDITERKRAEAEREHLLRAIEQTGEGIVITDSDGSINYVNPAFERMSGYSREEVLGESPDVLRSRFHDAGYHENLWRTISCGECWHGRFVNRRKDGSLFTVESHISPVTDESGAIVSYVAVNRDITDELRLAEEREHLEAQFRQAQKLESIGRLAGGVAHDLNNLLSPILGYGELLVTDLDESDPRRSSAQSVVQAAERARDLVRQLVTFSSKQVLEFKTVDLNAILTSFYKLLRRTIREDVAIEVSAGPDPMWIEGDVGQLEQVVMNLAVNAQDAMPSGGTLAIETARVNVPAGSAAKLDEQEPGSYARLVFRDNGSGMTGETLEHLFEPFFTTKARGRGTGLGLSTVYGIVKQHGASIEVDSVPGEGSTFTISIPLADSAAPEAEIADAPQGSRRGCERILLAEDDQSVRELAARILARHGYEVLTSSDAKGALDALAEAKGPVDLLLTDVIMPDLNGPELYAKVRQRCPAIKVVYMSGYTDHVVLPDGVSRSRSSFLQKPFSVDQLTEKVREALESSLIAAD